MSSDRSWVPVFVLKAIPAEGLEPGDVTDMRADEAERLEAEGKVSTDV